MKIIEITFYLQAGGAERFVVDLSNELSKDHDVTLLTLKDDTIDPNKRQFYKFDLSKRVKYKNLGFPKGANLKMLWQVYKYIKKEFPDVVHLNVAGVPLYCLLAILLLSNKIKFYQTIHSDVRNGYTSLFYKFLINFFGNRNKMGFVALSRKNYEDFISLYPKAKSVCIINGRAPITSTIKFDEVKQEIFSYKKTINTKIFIHIARCTEVKNQILLVEAFSKLINEGFDASLIVIGPNFDSEYGEKVKAKAASMVFFLGAKKNISDYLLNSDIFCLSSSFEGMPITMLESSLSGVPIVSTPVCGAIDLIQDGLNGIKSKDFSIESYVEALKFAYINFNTLKKNSNNMRYEGSYTIKYCADKYLAFFKS